MYSTPQQAEEPTRTLLPNDTRFLYAQLLYLILNVAIDKLLSFPYLSIVWYGMDVVNDSSNLL